jgi:hypothetical protein
MDSGTVESPAGKVLAVFMQQEGGKKVTLTGVVIDTDKLHVRMDGGRVERRAPWSPGVVGQREQEAMLSARRPRPGDTFTFERFEPVYCSVLTVRGAVKPAEEVDVLGARMKLLRVEMTPDEVKATNATVKPPKAVWWLDDKYSVVMRETELDGLGTLRLVRTTKEKALAPVSAPAVDIGRRSLVKLNRHIARPYDTRAMTYRVTVRDAEDAASLFVQDGHQTAVNARGKTFELRVHPAQAGERGEEKAAEEHLGTSHFIDHDDAKVKELTRRAVMDERDPWGKARRVERFVRNHMRTDNAADLTPASQTAKTLRGDCRHHALLTAAMCRAAGVPARTAIGLLYVQRDGPCLGFHMWAEVLIDGQWVGLDSTLGKGGVSATHVKVTHHSWHQTQSLTPLLPVSQVAGKLAIDVLKAE